ncbi:MAG TPA: ATP-binding protein [Tepidisphaeraceae bacterium]|jgi:PAS domain S-box-containing protein|nr:ATP-binding protein [Tepidisphaeraceae bacterium]
MISFRQKLVVGFGGVIVILLTVSTLGIAVLQQYRGALDKFFYENWRSTEYGQHMVDSLDAVDQIALRVRDADLSGGDANISAAEIAAAGPLSDFEINLQNENQNVTLAGEAEIAKDLSTKWAQYKTSFAKLISPDSSNENRRDAYASLQMLLPHVRGEAQAVIKLNLDNMRPIDGRAKGMANSAIRAMIVLAIIGTVIAAGFVFLVSRSLMGPLRVLTKSAKEIEQGNLDLTVQVKSYDEVGQLAEAFNSMAAKLREFRRTDRAKLVRTQRTTQLALGSLPDAVAIVSPDGKVEIANDTAQRLFGLQPGMAIGSTSATDLHSLFQRTVAERRTIQAKGYDAAIQIFNGEERFFLPMAVPIIDEDQQLVGVTMMLADITNLRKLDSMKSGLLSVVSHELKTPLTSIRMATHLLLEERVGLLTPKQFELASVAKDDSDRLYDIIENLLDLGRIEAGRELIELKPTAVERLVNAAKDDARSAFRDKGVTLESDVPADLPSVQADAERISHVFSNLLNNALKFTPSGGNVRIEARDGDDVVRFTIEDTGSGIAPEYLHRVFERFYRAPDQTNRGGAGLGLAIAKEIIDVHGGSISVQSKVGSGSRFSFALAKAAGKIPQADEAGKS